jgi:hypothetical protein
MSPVDERIGLDGKTRKQPDKRAKPSPDDDDEGESVSKEYVDLTVLVHKLKDRVSELTEALNAKEVEASRNWPADMAEKQIKKRDKCLPAIASWQRDLEQLYGEVTGQPVWRVVLTTKDGVRIGNGARLATRGEVEAYGQAIVREAGGGQFEILPCEHETANMQFVGTSLRFSHGDCVLLDWHPLADAP